MTDLIRLHPGKYFFSCHNKPDEQKSEMHTLVQKVQAHSPTRAPESQIENAAGFLYPTLRKLTCTTVLFHLIHAKPLEAYWSDMQLSAGAAFVCPS